MRAIYTDSMPFEQCMYMVTCVLCTRVACVHVEVHGASPFMVRARGEDQQVDKVHSASRRLVKLKVVDFSR